MKYGLVVLSIVLLVNPLVLADRSSPLPKDPDRSREKPKIVELSVDPAAAPRPALKYALIPEMLDRTPGNAAQLYLIAAQMASRERFRKYGEKINDWLKLPVNELPRAEIERMLNDYSAPLRQVELAARREECDWELPIRSEGFNVPLPPLNKFRELTNVLALKARLQIADGRIEDAIRTIQTGIEMGRDVAEGGLLIDDLVGVAIASSMLEAVQELMQLSGSPNLYWALVRLPRPLISLRDSLEYERSSVHLAFPSLRGAESRELTPDQWRGVTDDLARAMRLVRDEERGGMDRLLVTAFAIKVYPEAKRNLIAQGKTPEQVEAMPVPQVVIIHLLEQYNHWRDELFKWFDFPYWQGRAGMQRTGRAFEKWLRTEGKANTFIYFLPSVSRVYFLRTRLDRRVAALQCVEAIRMYAAEHEGKLPASLAEVTDVPVPIDPVTGKEFGYQVEGNTFTLDSPAPPGERPDQGIRYVVTLRR